MVKASGAGRELQRLALILVVAGVAIVAVPAVRLADAIHTNQEFELQNRRIADLRELRTQGRNVISVMFDGATHPEANAKQGLRSAILDFRNARTKAAGDGVKIQSADFEPAIENFVRKAQDLEAVPQSEWNTERTAAMANALTRIGLHIDNQITRDLEATAESARTKQNEQYAFLAAAILVTTGLALFVFGPTLKSVQGAFRDLDEKREEAGREAKERGAILSATTYAVLACDAEGLIRSANPAAGMIFRCEPSDLEGRRLEGLLGDQGHGLVRACQEGRTVETELRTMRLDGADAPVAVSLTPMEGGSFLAIVRDLSDREEVQHRLREEQARSRTLLKAIPDAMIRLDGNGNVTEYRPTAELDIVSNPESLYGHSLETALPAEAALAFRRARAGTMSGMSSAFVFNATLQGHERHIEARLAPMDGGALVLLRDVTERDEAIAKLRRSEATLAATQSAARLGSWEIDPATGRTAFSRGLRELLDLKPEDLEAVETIYARLTPESRDRLRTALAASETYDLTLRFVKADGKAFDARCQGGPREDRMLNIVQDVTDQLRQQAELVTAREAAERGAKAKSEFLANMSHEIRTPMNGIIGVVYLLQETDLSQRQRMYADTIQKSGENLLNLVSEVLDLSKIESGKMTLETKEFSLGEILRQITDVFSPGAREKHIRFQTIVDPGMPDRVLGDPTRVHQIVANLVGNAVKFTDFGGITLSARVLARTVHSANVEIRVSDSGIGIPADRLDAIFDTFTQADGTTTRRFGGTGLGLAITRQLVDLMGGLLSVQSEEGEGSEFAVSLEFALPAGSVPVVETRPIRVTATTDGIRPNVRILLVEDNTVNQMVVRDLLTARGCVVETAPDGAVAVQMALDLPFDLILMDVQMPRMDGYEATRRLRDLGLTTPIVAMTANALEGDRERCIEAGMDDYLPKPVRPPNLLAAVARWTDLSTPPLPIPTMDRNETAALFDRSVLIDMFGEGDPTLSFILEEWLRSTPGLIQEIANPDKTVAKAAAHQLKGSSRTVGANAIGDASEAFERELTPAAAQRVADLFPSTVKEIEAELGRAAV